MACTGWFDPIVSLLTMAGTVGAAVAALFTVIQTKKIALDANKAAKEARDFARAKLRLDLIKEASEMSHPTHGRNMASSQYLKAAYKMLKPNGYTLEEFQEMVMRSCHVGGAECSRDKAKQITKDWDFTE